MRKFLRILILVISIWVIIFCIDFICIRTIKRPVFMIKTNTYKDGGSTEYVGLFYKVIKCNTIDGDKTITLGTYSLKYSCQALTDSEKFSKEYSSIDKDNIFVYKTNNEIINILKHGKGLVYLGFKECPWCNAYVPMLNDIAKENNIEKIYYLNILNERKENTKEYLEIVDILKEHLRYDDEGKKRIYVPAVIAINNGNIVGFDDETSYDTLGYDDPKDYWTEERKQNLKEKLVSMISKIEINDCTECNKPE